MVTAIYCLPTMQINCLFPSLVSDNFFAKVQNLNCFLMFPLHLSLLKNIIPDFNSNWNFPIKWEPEEGQKFISSWNSHLLSTTVNNINFLGFVWHITSWVYLPRTWELLGHLYSVLRCQSEIPCDETVDSQQSWSHWQHTFK